MEHPRTAVVVSSLIIEHEGKILFLEESREEGIRFNIPGGHVDSGESPEEAALREGKEETGYDLRLVSCVGVLVNTWTSSHSVRLIFRAAIMGGEPSFEAGTAPHWLDLEEFKAKRPGIEPMRGIDQIIEMVAEGLTNQLRILDYRNK